MREKSPKARQNQGFGILIRPTGEVPAGRCPHRPERRNYAPKIPHISVGAGVHDGPSKSTPHLYISHRQRQRRRSRDDSTFYAPCKFLQTCGTHYNKHPVCGARKGFLNRRIKRRFLHTFCRCWQKVCRRRLTRPPPSPLDRRRPRAVQYSLTVMPVFPSNSRNRSLLCRNFSTPTAGFPILPRG